MLPRLRLLTAVIALPALASAATPATDPVKGETVFTPSVAVALGVTEGLTEYLPVSSTGHLILVNAWMGLEVETPMADLAGAPIMVEHKTSRLVGLVEELQGRPAPASSGRIAYTLKQASDDYSIVIQFGAILAVLFAFWARIRGTVAGLFRLDPASLRLTRNLIVAFIPAAALGLTFGKVIDHYLFNPFTVATALILGGIAMLWADRHHRRHVASGAGEGPDLSELTVKQAATIGFCQCAALWPGTSRSMATIVGGYVANLSPARATEFSFLLGFLTLSAASLYKGLKHGPQLLAAFPPAQMFIGMSVAGIVAFLSVKWMIGWITRHGLAAFAWYRFALAFFVIAWFA